MQKKLIYYGHIQSHLTYCLSVWGNLICYTLLNKLQKLQNKCICYIKGKCKNSPIGILRVCDLVTIGLGTIGKCKIWL